jgi:hypothetical protein
LKKEEKKEIPIPQFYFPKNETLVKDALDKEMVRSCIARLRKQIYWRLFHGVTRRDCIGDSMG